MTSLAREKCVTLSDDNRLLEEKDIKQFHQMQVPMWEVTKIEGSRKLRRIFTLPSTIDTIGVVNRIAACAEIEAHHPVMLLDQKNLTVDCWSHDLRGLHRNDFIIAAKIDEIYLDWMDELHKKDPVTVASEQSFPASDAPGWVGKKGEEAAEA